MIIFFHNIPRPLVFGWVFHENLWTALRFFSYVWRDQYVQKGYSFSNRMHR